MNSINIDGIDFHVVHVPTAKSNILLIQAANGFLGCGYFDVAVANRLGDAAAIVTGVKKPEDMLVSLVVRLSDRARKMGVREGMSGREALLVLQKSVP